jgi:wobble nucleotide-excising tRNase
MAELISLVEIIMVFSIPLAAILGGYYIKLQKMKMRNDYNGNSSELNKQVGSLIAENEEIKERLKNLEYIITDEGRRIDLEYEKEQIRLDKENKL